MFSAGYIVVAQCLGKDVQCWLQCTGKIFDKDVQFCATLLLADFGAKVSVLVTLSQIGYVLYVQLISVTLQLLTARMMIKKKTRTITTN